MLFISGSGAVHSDGYFYYGFNLAIEMLFISGARGGDEHLSNLRFNLAIEMLFISGTPAVSITAGDGGFNLAIEMLFISG